MAHDGKSRTHRSGSRNGGARIPGPDVRESTSAALRSLRRRGRGRHRVQLRRRCATRVLDAGCRAGDQPGAVDDRGVHAEPGGLAVVGQGHAVRPPWRDHRVTDRPVARRPAGRPRLVAFLLGRRACARPARISSAAVPRLRVGMTTAVIATTARRLIYPALILLRVRVAALATAATWRLAALIRL